MTLSVATVTRKLAILLVGAAAEKLNNNILTGRKKCIAMVTVSSSHICISALSI